MDIQRLFQDLYDRRDQLDAPDYFHYFTKAMAEGLWRDYEAMLVKFPSTLAGKDFLDFGCKFGHVVPQALGMGARTAVGIDVEEEYVAMANRIFGRLYPGANFHRTDECLIPVPSESVDCLLANEVISHINPMFLETFYAEASRVLRVGGHILISDGNNLANAACREALPPLYQAWENGPAGTATDRDVVNESFEERRRKLIRQHYADLSEDEVKYLAVNTSGLFGPQLLRVVDDYVGGRVFVERRYRRGLVPTNPNASGVVMERGFYPQQVEMALHSYGIDARQIFAEPSALPFTTWRGRVRRMLSQSRNALRRWAAGPDDRRGEQGGFQILGVKRF